MKNKESLYLSFLVTITIIFSIFCISLNYLSEIFHFFQTYARYAQFKIYTNFLFVFITVLLWVVYGYWRKATLREQELELIIGTINYDALIVTDSQNKITKTNESIERILGYNPQRIHGKKIQAILGLDYDGLLFEQFYEDKNRKRFVKDPLKCKKKNGEIVYTELIIEKMSTGKGSVVLVRDISERVANENSLKQLNEKLADQVRIDDLTGAFNRRGLEERLLLEHDRAKRDYFDISVLLIDIDNFKQINEHLGHGGGDAVLKDVSNRITRVIRSTDTIGRIGSNEFLVVLPSASLSAAMMVAEKIRLAVASCPLPPSQKQLQISASMGVATVPQGQFSIEEILALTRRPLQRSKELGKNRITQAGNEFYKHDRSSAEKARVVNQMLEGECFYPVAQPIIRLKDKKIIGCELLSRCTIEDLEDPYIFFGFALENDILTSVDIQCLKKCLKSSSRLKKPMTCHINIYPSTLLSMSVDALLKLINPMDIPYPVCLEFSERQLVGSPESLQEPVKELKKAGVLIALDDVGFGRSSLETLISLEPDIVKIDRLYIEGIVTDDVKRRSFQRMVSMLNGIDVQQIIEGIETKEEIEILLEMGAEFGQGYSLAKPKKT